VSGQQCLENNKHVLLPGCLQIDEYLTARGQTVKRARLDELVGGQQQQQQLDTQQGQQQQQLTAEDLAGWSKVGSGMSTLSAGVAGGDVSATPTLLLLTLHACALQVQQLMATMAAAAQGGQEQEAAGCCSSDSNTRSESAGASGSSMEGSADSSSSSGPATKADDGVVQVSPDDVDAWARVQQLKQQSA
jgi:hypothetical protein